MPALGMITAPAHHRPSGNGSFVRGDDFMGVVPEQERHTGQRIEDILAQPYFFIKGIL
jgi:hypothetical protein